MVADIDLGEITFTFDDWLWEWANYLAIDPPEWYQGGRASKVFIYSKRPKFSEEVHEWLCSDAGTTEHIGWIDGAMVPEWIDRFYWELK